MSKAQIAGILKTIEARPKAVVPKSLRPAGVQAPAAIRAALGEQAWACIPAKFKAVNAGDRRIVVVRGEKRDLVSVAAASREDLLHVINTHDRTAIAANIEIARNEFRAAVKAEGLSYAVLGNPANLLETDGIAVAADGRAVYWKAAPQGFEAYAGLTPAPPKTAIAEFQLKTGLLAGIDAVNLKLLSEQTETTAFRLREMDRSTDIKVLAELALRAASVLSVFKFEGERQATFAELQKAVNALRVVAALDFHIERRLNPASDSDEGEFELWNTAEKKMVGLFPSYEEAVAAAEEQGGKVGIGPLSKKVEAAAVSKEFDPKGEQATPPGDNDHRSDLLDDKKRPAVVIDIEPEKDPLKVKESLYSAKEVSIADIQKAAGKWALAVWCVTMEEARAKAKDLERRRADYMPLPDRWIPPAPEAAGEGVEEVKNDLNDGKTMRVKEIKTPSSPQALEKSDAEAVDTAGEQVQKLRTGQVMAAISAAARQNPADKKLNQEIERAWYRLAHGVQVDIMDIPKIFDETKALVQSGKSVDEATAEVRDKYRQNGGPGEVMAADDDIEEAGSYSPNVNPGDKFEDTGTGKVFTVSHNINGLVFFEGDPREAVDNEDESVGMSEEALVDPKTGWVRVTPGHSGDFPPINPDVADIKSSKVRAGGRDGNCPDCDGTGKTRCETCLGSGWVRSDSLKKSKKSVMAGNLRSVRVTFDDGNVINTNMAAGLSDEDIKSYYSVGKEFNVGSGANDKMAKVAKVEIMAMKADNQASKAKVLNWPAGEDELEAAKAWQTAVIDYMGAGYHPDDPGADYIELTADQPTFTAEEAAKFDELRGRAHDAFEKAGADIYEHGLAYLDKQGLADPDVKAQWVDQDRKPVKPEDVEKGRKMAKERRDAMESMDKELSETGRLTNKVKADTGMGEHDSEDIDGMDVRIWDNGGETADRYTIVIEDPGSGAQSWLGSGDEPFHPQGFGQHVGDETTGNQEGPHLGKRVYFKDVPEDVQKFIKQDAKAMAGDKQNERNAEHGVDGAKIKAEGEGYKGYGIDRPGEGRAKVTTPAGFEDRARQALAKSLGVKPDELEAGDAYSREPYGSLPDLEAAYFDHGNEEYTVFNEVNADEFAKAGVRNDWESEGPSLFNADFIAHHIDRESLQDYMAQVFGEWAENDVNELDDKEKEAWLEKQGGLIPEVAEGGDEPDIAAIFDTHREDWIAEYVSDRMGNDDGETWWTDNVGADDFKKIIADNGFYDVDGIVEEAVSVDGAGHFLSAYDGDLHDIGDGMVYARWN